MVSTDQGWGPHVESLREEFRIRPGRCGVVVTRTTTIRATRPWRRIKELAFYLGLKRVHLHVFKNWLLQAERVRGPGP